MSCFWWGSLFPECPTGKELHLGLPEADGVQDEPHRLEAASGVNQGLKISEKQPLLAWGR